LASLFHLLLKRLNPSDVSHVADGPEEHHAQLCEPAGLLPLGPGLGEAGCGDGEPGLGLRSGSCFWADCT
jgi:hypothetical protein